MLKTGKSFDISKDDERKSAAAEATAKTEESRSEEAARQAKADADAAKDAKAAPNDHLRGLVLQIHSPKKLGTP